ncbi:MAG TPA: RidA family protein [Aestuariivirga sp.]|nr:RidA family protein [Aestuariivirga sp.]
MTRVSDRLGQLGITLSSPPRPVANYVPWVKTGNLVFVSGQLPVVDGTATVAGILGASVSVEQAQAAARQAGINVITQLNDACGGDLDRVVRVVKLGGFVAATADFTQYPQVMNGASDLMVEVFGEAGRHARTTVGVPSLPLNVCIEIDAIVEVR